MKLDMRQLLLFGLAVAATATTVSADMMDMGQANSASDEGHEGLQAAEKGHMGSTEPMPWPLHHHGLPILETKLTESQRAYWESYNTTTYLTMASPYSGYLSWHLALLTLSAFVLYPFVLIFNNVQSSWFLPTLTVQAAASLLSCIFYSVFISNVPNLYPGMAYSKMILGLFVFTLLQYLFAVLNCVLRWANSNESSGKFHSLPPISNIDDEFELQNIHSPSATLYGGDDDNDDVSDLQSNDSSNTAIDHVLPQHSSPLKAKTDSILNKLYDIPFVNHMLNSFNVLITVLFNASTWGLFFYFIILFPTGVACLNLMGQGKRVFNLLAHFIKGGVFMSLGLLSLARYCGSFQQMGGSWNYSYVSPKKDRNLGLLLRLQRPGSCITSFEMMESSLILFYGCTNIFLEHLNSPAGVWSAKDLQHASIAFMYIGTGLCGVLTELKLSNWRKALFYKNVPQDLLPVEKKDLCVTPGFSPNPFPVFTIFWTGLLMSKHAQASSLSTEIHVQWGSLLTYGSFFRVFTFLLLTFTPVKNQNLFLPGKPLTELVTSFCLLCGGFVFMQSTDQVIEALAYRGFTPMFTINVSVGLISLLMAWIMVIFAFKDKIKQATQKV